ncbi:hypothetical protein BDY21DRAFT_318834 [Lineolata rhizophorae]|uniref:Ubiquitin carrier protein n=1 Tax=Lineolata rhizophorae TaxID=578093 RepID=A0A6A6P485_9PEZI|nr:hypothetical protein BDY21DRAFT_318834 [Lineolata rhizophorae]
MTGSVVHKLVRRGVEYGSNYMAATPREGDHPKMPVWGVIILAMTLATFVFFLLSVGYTIGGIVTTLTMVETRTETVTIEAPSESGEPADPLLKGQDPMAETVTVRKTKPITSSIRSTIRHLHSIGGFRARWRGLSAFFAFAMADRFLTGLLARLMGGSWAAFCVAAVLAKLPVVQLNTAWTHIVISEPSPLPWYKRVPALRAVFKPLAPAVVVCELSVLACRFVVFGAWEVMGLDGPEPATPQSGKEVTIMALKIVAAFAIEICVFLFVVLPAHVTAVRIQASLLPDDHETIVPFDRSFGGKVVPAIMGGSGAVGFVDAWRSFGWEARWRLVKLYVKIFLIVNAVVIFAALILGLESFLIMGKDASKMVDFTPPPM